MNNSVTFETNGGSSVASQTIETGKTALEPSNPIKENYSFVGWYSDSSLTTPFNFETPITKTTILYAKWTPIVYTITFDAVTGVTFDKNNPLTVNSGSNTEITIIADLGYRLKSVKVNGVEKLPLLNNKLILTNIIENKKVVVKVEKIEYDVIAGDGQKHIIGKNEDAVFKIDADKDLFHKVYLNDEQLDSEFYTITEGSTIITLKQDFLNNLLPNTYNLRALFSDGGEANTTFVIEQLTESNPKTGDSIMLSIIFGSFSLIGLLGAGLCLKKKNL